jgi:hydroxyethylthiazole kinase-like uncharacterized protein yjeF
MTDQQALVLSAAQMREVDRRCIEDVGIPGVVLMNNAGAEVFKFVEKGPVGVVCGKGNNGGDGYVVARMALLAGLETRLVMIANPDDITGDAAIFLRAYQNVGGALQVATDDSTAKVAVAGLGDCAVLVDGLLGTGVRGEVRGPIRAAIEAWPTVHTIAIDLPSGLNADTGEICGCCIQADHTVTFQFAKQGFLRETAKGYLGKLHIADIGIPKSCAEDL